MKKTLIYCLILITLLTSEVPHTATIIEFYDSEISIYSDRSNNLEEE